MTVTAAPAAETFVWVRGEPTSELDDEIAGVYLLMVDPALGESDRVTAALDCFHGKIGIDELDAFEIFVTDETGRVLVEADEPSEGGDAQFMGSIAEDDIPNGGEPIWSQGPSA